MTYLQEQTLDKLQRENLIMKNTLHQISLCSQNSMSSINECGSLARRTLNMVEGITDKPV